MSYLSGIASYVGTQENYSVSISPERALYAPNSTGTAFSTAGMLKSVTATGPGDGYPNLGYSWNFSYEQPVACNNPPCLGDGTLTEVQLPQGGYLQWSYSPFEYVGTTTLWEVASRSLQSAVGNSPPPANTYTFTRPSADVSAAITVHSGTPPAPRNPGPSIARIPAATATAQPRRLPLPRLPPRSNLPAS